jgi:hypothetical protein
MEGSMAGMAAYCERWRAVWLAIVGRSCKDVLLLCERSVYRYLYLFNAPGYVSTIRAWWTTQAKLLNDFEEFTALHVQAHIIFA